MKRGWTPVGPDLKNNGGGAATERDSKAKGDLFWDRP